MSQYRLTPVALEDLDGILLYVSENYGQNRADQLEDSLFGLFGQLAQFPGLGHRRSDLTRHPFLFFPENPYLVIYERDAGPLIIHGVLHASRDIARQLKKRST